MHVPIILLYHQISDLPVELDPYRISVPVDAFERHMAYLDSAGYQVLTLSDAVKRMRAGVRVPPKTLVITFDDGYRDNYTHALPVLQRYGFPATIFLVADYVGQSAAWDGEGGSRLALLGLDEIRVMQQAGVEFGSHTRTHAALNTLDAVQIAWELTTSKQMLEAQLGTPVETLAYPYENFDSRVQVLAEESGYLAACGTFKMPETYYNLWRVEIGQAEHDIRHFRWKLSRVRKSLNRAKLALRPVKRLLRRPFSRVSHA